MKYSPWKAMRCWTAMPPPSALTRSRFPLGDRLGVVEEPAQAGQRHLTVDRLEHVKENG